MGLQPHLFKLTETTSNRNTNYTSRNIMFRAILKKVFKDFLKPNETKLLRFQKNHKVLLHTCLVDSITRAIKTDL